MKLFKKMFGAKPKPKQVSRYKSNTLADLNESPDLRTENDENHEVTASNVSAPTPKVEAKAGAKCNSAKKNPTSAKSAQGGTKSGASSTAEAPKSNKNTTVKKKVEILDKELESKLELSNIDNKIEDSQNKTVVNKVTSSTTEDANEVTNEPTKSARNGRFEIKKSKDGRYVFNLYASNSVIVATSQVYSSSTAAMNGIKSVIANVSAAQIEDQTLKAVTTVSFPKWEIYRDKSEHYRFRLCASNGSCVCHSQGYTSKTNCKKGIESIIKFAPGAEITKTYLKKDK